MSSGNGYLSIRCEPIAVNGVEAARLLSVSDRHWRMLRAQDLVPAPISLGHRQLWLVEDLRVWAALGCPSREQWEEAKRKRP